MFKRNLEGEEEFERGRGILNVERSFEGKEEFGR